MSPGSKISNLEHEQIILSAKQRKLALRTQIIRTLRRYFYNKDYLEIETPNLIPAPAPESNIDALGAGDWFLHTSPELCMKRMLAAGYQKIFQICKCYRKGEQGEKHLPEFTLVEWYRADADYLALMEECEEIVRFLAMEIGLGDQVLYDSNTIDLAGPWDRITVQEAFNKYTSVTMEKALELDIFDELMAGKIEPCLGFKRPVFAHDYPASLAALSKLRNDDSDIAERFELYISGIELANAFSELNDAGVQKERFEEEMDKRNRAGKTPYPIPEKFLKTLEDMPDAAGIALGLDRLIMVLTDSKSIDEVVAFTPEML